MHRVWSGLLKFLGILLLCISPCLLCGLGLFAGTVENNLQLRRFAQVFYDYPLPERTQVISRNAEVGLMGNGNHCDFEVEQVLVSELSREELERYYEDVEFPPVRSEPQPYNGGESNPGVHPPVWVVTDFIESQEYPGKTVLRIRLHDGVYPAGLDYRCH
jgi:hypothetical protein